MYIYIMHYLNFFCHAQNPSFTIKSDVNFPFTSFNFDSGF